VRFVSAEPLLGPLDLSPWLAGSLHWVIVGGESGPGARPCQVDWVRDLMQQCQQAGGAVSVKRLGANALGSDLAPCQAKISHPKGGTRRSGLPACASGSGPSR
jgi:protein gp37